MSRTCVRRILVPLVAALLGASACGSGGSKNVLDSLTPGAAIRAAAQHASSGSSKLDLQIDSQVQGHEVSITGSGAFAYDAGSVVGSMVATVGGAQIEERITGGNLYLKVPGQDGFYKLPLRDLVGTQLAQTSNPASSAQLLAAIGDSAKKVGTETIRGVRTTHFTGTIDVAAAAAKFKGSLFAALGVQKLKDSGVATIPVDAFLDDQGRLRRVQESLTLTVQGLVTKVDTRIDFYDFGTKVDVQPPPADQVKDGSALLSQLKSQLRSH